MLLPREPWMDAAPCLQADPEIFFPERGDRAATHSAKAICARCPVIEPCLELAIEEDRKGIWGGTTDRERRRLGQRGRRQQGRWRHGVGA